MDGKRTSSPSVSPVETAQKKIKRSGRGPSKGIKSIPGVKRVLQWDELGRPHGKYYKDYKNHLGEISRCKISILHDDWSVVPTGVKDMLWEDVKVILITKFQ